MIRLLIPLALAPIFSIAQEVNNLVLPPGYPTTTPGSIGAVKIFHQPAKKQIVLIPGWGLDDRHYADFINDYGSGYEFHVVNVPGYQHTAVPPLPMKSYGEQVWTNAVVEGIWNYIQEKRLSRPLLIGHLATSTQIAVRLGIAHPDAVGGIIIMAGPTALQITGARSFTLQERIRYQDEYIGPKWFKTVTREVWNAGNYPPWFYSRDSLAGTGLFNAVAENALPVMIQYLQEFNAQDTEEEVARLRTRMLVLLPDFSNAPKEGALLSMLRPSFIDPWRRVAAKNSYVSIVEVMDSHAFITIDQPEILRREIDRFTDQIHSSK